MSKAKVSKAKEKEANSPNRRFFPPANLAHGPLLQNGIHRQRQFRPNNTGRPFSALQRQGGT